MKKLNNPPQFHLRFNPHNQEKNLKQKRHIKKQNKEIQSGEHAEGLEIKQKEALDQEQDEKEELELKQELQKELTQLQNEEEEL